MRFHEFVDPVEGSRWNIDMDFMASNWECRWGDGCQGILPEPAVEKNEGCCSAGAHLANEEEAMLISALGSSLDPARFQNHAAAARDGVVTDVPATRVVDDACVFFNKPGFSGGVGCALYLAALDEGEDPNHWRPAICWQAPLLVDHHDDGSKTLRPWGRADFQPEVDVSWCCTDRGSGCFTGEVPVAISLRGDLRGILGPDVAASVELGISAP